MNQTTSYQFNHNITKFDLKQKSILKTNRTTYLNEGKNYNPIVELRQYNYIVIYIVISLFLFYFILFLHHLLILVVSL